MITRDIHAFMARDWAATREAKDQYWSERVGRLGPIEAVRVANELRRQAQLRDPDWPCAADRHEDLASHLRVATLLRRADSARRA